MSSSSLGHSAEATSRSSVVWKRDTHTNGAERRGEGEYEVRKVLLGTFFDCNSWVSMNGIAANADDSC